MSVAPQSTSPRQGKPATAAQAALQTLLEAGIDTVFGNPGTTELPLIKALADEPDLHYGLYLHEGAALSAAAGYALVTGGPAVALVHAMPGTANALSMHFNCWRGGVPVVLIAGTQDRRQQHRNPVLQADLTDVMNPVSKRVWEVRTADEIPETLLRAIADAAAPPCGPVFLSVPIDLWNEPITAPRPRIQIRQDPLGPPAAAAVEAVCELLVESASPAFVSGDVSALRDANDELVELAELLGAPVYWAPASSLASFPSTSACYRGPMFPNASSFARVFDNADAILGVGAEVIPTILYEVPQLIPAETRIAAIAETPGDRVGILAPEVSVLGDISVSLAQVSAGVRARLEADPERAQAVELRREKVLAEGTALREKLRGRASKAAELPGVPAPAAAVKAILDAAPDDVIVVEEGVSNSGWVTLLGDFPDSRSYLALARGGSLGYALGAAAGASKGSDRPVLVVVGDGALMYGPQALWTMANEELPIVVCVLNNDGYEILRDFIRSPYFSPELSENGGGRAPATQMKTLDINGPLLDFCSLARGCGLEAERAEGAAACAEAVAAAFAAGGPRLIEVPVTSPGAG